MPAQTHRNSIFGALAAIAAMAALLAAAAPASATLRVSSTGTGLLLEDKNATFDDNVRLSLVTSGSQLEWRINKHINCGTGCLDLIRFDIGAGCHATSSGDIVACSRLAGRVTANLRGGNDTFILDSTVKSAVTITDPITVSASSGSDLVIAGAGDDTIQGGSGDDSLFGAGGIDTIEGSIGNDRVFGDAGNDTLNGDDGNDTLTLGTGADTADAGAGDDLVQLATTARDERDEVQGGIGFDRATYSIAGSTGDRLTPLRIIEANLETLAGEKDTTENDVLRSIESYGGGEGNDILTGVLSSNDSQYTGEDGDDTIFGSSAANTVTGGAGSDSLDGNEGNDIVDAKTGEGSTADADPLIDCGTGTNDLAILDLLDDATPSGCENIDRSPAGEGPHVRPSFGRVVSVASGAATVRLSCPRALRRACRGTLELRVGAARTARTSYSVPAGASRRVAVRLGALRIGARAVGEMLSREQGVKGLKTTLRRIVLRG
jgi:Ca2+-binding RTX toxin-like protein